VHDLKWKETITVRHSGTVSPAELPHHCCTPAGRLGPYDNPSPGGSPILQGQLCSGMVNWSQVWGRACY
jgi:hypothetical protein